MSTVHGFSLKVGGTQFTATHPADHDKIGVAFGMSFNEDKSHSLLIDAKIGFQTRDVVNPGAGITQLHQTRKKIKVAQLPLWRIFSIKLKSNHLLERFHLGRLYMRWTLEALTQITFQNLFTYKQEWSFKPMSFIAIKAEALLSLSINKHRSTSPFLRQRVQSVG